MCSQSSEPFICICPNLETPSLALLWGGDDRAVGACTWDVAAGREIAPHTREQCTQWIPGSHVRGGIKGHILPDSGYMTF